MRALKLSLLVLLALSLASCAQKPIVIDPDEPIGFFPQTIFYATNRVNTGSDNLNKRFGTARAPISYGYNLLSIPYDFPKAQSTNFLYWTLPVSRNPNNRLALIDSIELRKEAFTDSLARSYNESDSPGLLFIHGYNTTYERAVRILGKLAYDIDLTGPAILYSWPSDEKFSAYSSDENSLIWVQPEFEQFIVDMLEAADEQLIIVGHSLGGRLVARGVSSVLIKRPDLAPHIKSVVLAAPDVDSEIFARDMAPVFINLSVNVTVYASDGDVAMDLSNNLFGYPRLGAAGEDLFIMPGIDTIDASDSDGELIGHEYFSQGPQTIADIYYAFIRNMPPQARPTLSKMSDPRGTYWRLNP